MPCFRKEVDLGRKGKLGILVGTFIDCWGGYFSFVFDLLPLAFLVVDLAELGVAAAGVGPGMGGVVEVVADGVEAAGGADVESVVVVGVVGVPVADVVEPSAAGVVPGGSGFLNGSSQVCRT